MAAAIVKAARKGIPPSTAAQAAGIPPQTVRAWAAAARAGAWPDGSSLSPQAQQTLSALSEDIAVAQAEWEAEQAELITDAAKDRGKSGIREWRASAWLLNNHPATRQQWREHRELKVEHQGQVSHEHRLVRQLEEPQVLELAGPDFADLVG